MAVTDLRMLPSMPVSAVSFSMTAGSGTPMLSILKYLENRGSSRTVGPAAGAVSAGAASAGASGADGAAAAAGGAVLAAAAAGCAEAGAEAEAGTAVAVGACVVLT